jgi:hypothetical protein
VVAHLVEVGDIVLHFEIHKQFLLRIKNFCSVGKNLIHMKFLSFHGGEILNYFLLGMMPCSQEEPVTSIFRVDFITIQVYCIIFSLNIRQTIVASKELFFVHLIQNVIKYFLTKF